MAEIEGFSNAVQKEIGFYVYRLIDPRNGETFYVGKGQDNRIFAHVSDATSIINDSNPTTQDSNDTEPGEDKDSLKVVRINEIRGAGLQVLHVIHRHGIKDEQTAYEVEAALMDCYPGLTNRQGGHGSHERGTSHALEIQNKYSREEMKIDPTHKLLVIKTNETTKTERDGSIYEATRWAWRLSLARAERANYILGVIGGVCEGCFVATEWKRTEDGSRCLFEGEDAPEDIKVMYVNKLIPSDFRKKGASNPISYVNC